MRRTDVERGAEIDMIARIYAETDPGAQRDARLAAVAPPAASHPTFRGKTGRSWDHKALRRRTLAR